MILDYTAKYKVQSKYLDSDYYYSNTSDFSDNCYEDKLLCGVFASTLGYQCRNCSSLYY